VVSINRFPSDTEEELELVERLAKEAGVERVVVNDGYARGGEGALDLARAVVEACERPASFSPLVPATTPVREQIEAIARRVYGADGVDYLPKADRDIARIEAFGMAEAPVCMAKTHLSLSHDPALRNRPTGFRLPVREVVPSAGAGFLVVLCGDIQRMPGLGRTPNFMGVDIDDAGRTVGLF
jgi:formyltetrahydrofolate synthetase